MQRLIKLGYFVMRSPASGRGSRKMWYPDIVAIRKGRPILIEVKERGDNRDIYIDKQQYRQYMYIRDLAGAEFYLCVYYKSIGDFRCINLEVPDYATDRYVVFRFETFRNVGLRVEEVFK